MKKIKIFNWLVSRIAWIFNLQLVVLSVEKDKQIFTQASNYGLSGNDIKNIISNIQEEFYLNNY
ncbi:MAG: hypothetical protein AABY22_31930 [Nanoarchaeota archaeon]